MADISELTAREREVLQWFAEGKSAEDVALLLGLSTATVMFHYRQVAIRWNTLNRTHTIVEAIRRGQLDVRHKAAGLTSILPVVLMLSGLS